MTNPFPEIQTPQSTISQEEYLFLPKSDDAPDVFYIDEIKQAFFERFYRAGSIVFPDEQTPLSARIVNAQWEMFKNQLGKIMKKNVNTPDTEKRIFVFGSNEAGVHGAGAALFAIQNRGAVYGIGVGHVGQSYAIPTKSHRIETLPLEKIKPYVDDFLVYAKANPRLHFQVTRIGCGLAGYTDTDIAPMFVGAPKNCDLPDGWRDYERKSNTKNS